VTGEGFFRELMNESENCEWGRVGVTIDLNGIWILYDAARLITRIIWVHWHPCWMIRVKEWWIRGPIEVIMIVSHRN